MDEISPLFASDVFLLNNISIFSYKRDFQPRCLSDVAIFHCHLKKDMMPLLIYYLPQTCLMLFIYTLIYRA